MARGLFKHFSALLSNSDALEAELQKTIGEVGEDAELIFAAHARPVRRSGSYRGVGRMERGVKAEREGSNVVVTVHAKDPLTGFDYVAVTRFGHRKEFIEPRKDRARASVLTSGGRRGTVRKGNAALRFSIGGRVFYRRRVRGFKPLRDWADDAIPEVNERADVAMRTLGQKLIVGRF